MACRNSSPLSCRFMRGKIPSWRLRALGVAADLLFYALFVTRRLLLGCVLVGFLFLLRCLEFLFLARVEAFVIRTEFSVGIDGFFLMFVRGFRHCFLSFRSRCLTGFMPLAGANVRPVSGANAYGAIR